MTTFRSRKLLDIAHDAPCFVNIAIPCGNDRSIPAHSDMLKHGRGVGHKSGDHFAVSCCPNCHSRFTREFLGRDQYQEIWQQSFEKYLTWLWESGKVVVK